MDLTSIKKTSWYRQQTEGTPYFIYGPCCGCLTWFKAKKEIVWYCSHDEARSFLDKEYLRMLAEKYLEVEKKKKGFFEDKFADWLKQIRDVNEKLFKEIDSSDLSKLSDAAILKINRELASQSYKMWTMFFLDIYDADAEGIIESELVAEGITLSWEEKKIMTAQIKLLALQREELDLINIAKLIYKNSEIKSAFLYINSPSNLHRLKLWPKIEKALEEHQKSFFWIRNNLAYTQIVSVFDFVEQLKQMLFSSRDIIKEGKELEKFEKNIANQKEKIVKKHKMSNWLKQMFNIFGLLAYWRDVRKEQLQKMNHYLELLGREIARRSKMDWEDLKFCDARAIDKLPVSMKLVNQYKKLLSTSRIMVWDEKKVVHLSPKESLKVEHTLEETINMAVSEIRGMIACPGKAEGEVVVINKLSEFNKMKQGNVLVTVMTRPEFVPLMKKAAAIITDEGGITSHAAVVSRELRVPCVIGTQVATKKLKDGDYVLVNANHGTVLKKDI